MSNNIRQAALQTDSVADEGFLQRWSRRKQQINEGLPLEEDPVVEQALEVNPEEIQAPVLTDVDMPPIESLGEHSDYTGFMSPGVSDQLRNLALRKLFGIPVFNIRDGLDDYDDDFTYFAKLGDIITCDMKHMMEVEARKKAEKLLAEQQAEAEQGLVAAEVVESEEELVALQDESQLNSDAVEADDDEMDVVESMIE
jgi:hypothetical protein